MARLPRSRRHSCVRLGSKLAPGGAPGCRAPNPIETIGSDRGVRAERQGHPVDAVAQPRGRRPIFEDVTQMSAAAPAMHFRARHEQEAVGGGADSVRQRTIEARPTGPAVVFGVGREQREIAAGAGEHAFALLVIERARARSSRCGAGAGLRIAPWTAGLATRCRSSAPQTSPRPRHRSRAATACPQSARGRRRRPAADDDRPWLILPFTKRRATRIVSAPGASVRDFGPSAAQFSLTFTRRPASRPVS